MKRIVFIGLLVFSVSYVSQGKQSQFGDYPKPELLLKLENYQKKNRKKARVLGFRIQYKDDVLPMTPIDAIPFARTRDGGQLSFLTDFGTTQDLAQAPIVIVYPFECVECEWTQIVAMNLEAFLQLSASLDESYWFELFQYILTKQNQKEFPVSSNDEYSVRQYDSLTIYVQRSQQQNIDRVVLLKEQFGIDASAEPIKMTEDMLQWRKEIATIETFGDFGINYGNEVVKVDRYYERLEEVTLVEEFLGQSTLPERLRFYRDVLYLDEFYYLEEDVQSQIKELIINYLKKDGLNREAEVLDSQYVMTRFFSWK